MKIAAERRARATWGPTNVTTGAPLVYAPRWKTDHHPWLVDGSSIRYAGHEVEEVNPTAAIRAKVDALDTELRRADLDDSVRATLTIERNQLTS